jgi:hypothetical protein
MEKVASISHDMYVHRTMFIKPIMSHNHTQSICGGKGVNQSIPTCHHCGITSQISLASANSVTVIWWCNSPRRNVIYLTAVANGL